jgi:hypothetical protein
MAKKKMGKFHDLHITPMAGTHYKMRHEPVRDEKEMQSPMMGGEDEKNEKLFAHGEREGIHKHLDALLDAHEGKGGGEMQSGEQEPPTVPKDHPLRKLSRKM